MANSNEESKKTSSMKEHGTKQRIKNNSSTPSKSNSLLTLGALIIALLALVASFYTFSLNEQLKDQLIDKNEQIAAKNNQFTIALEKLSLEQDKIQEQIAIKASNIEETGTTLQSKFEELNKQLQTAMSQRFYQNQNWLLLKTRYYLDLAQINAHWSNDVSPTVALLQQADQLLKQINDPQIFTIRQAIAKDIAELQAIPKLDIIGILSQLDAAQNSVNELSISSALSDKKPTVEENLAIDKNSKSVWQLRLQDSLDVLSRLVVIRHHDEHIKPLISPELEAVLKETIHLNLQEAQWAVLNNNPEVYQLALDQAITTIKKHFGEGVQNTTALIKKLSELQKIELIQKRPDIGSALPLLNQLIDTNKSRAPQKTSVTEQGEQPR